MIALDDNGNFVTDANDLLTATSYPATQNSHAELRCLQGTWFIDPFFGRNAIVWGIAQSVQDRALDISRIVSKYTSVISASYNSETAAYEVQAINA